MANAAVAPMGMFSVVAFGRHFLSMLLAMMVGCVLTCGILLGALNLDLGVRSNGLWFGIIVSAAMTLTMGLWMLYRMHHSWRSTAEMSAAMFVPLVVFIGPYWAGWIPGVAFCTVICVAMVPAMLGVMAYRRNEYGMVHHGSHSAADVASHPSGPGHASPEPEEHCH